MKFPFNKSLSSMTLSPEKIKNITILTNNFDKIILIKAMSNGNKLGYLNFTQYDGANLKLADIFVFENYRNLGVGTELLKKSIELAASLGVKKIFGVMVGEIERLTIFYKSFGFSIIGKNIELNLTKLDSDHHLTD
ncbi:GNAT family N-acetyltransferase [Serratia grimesii]|jgi:GNAT superfamily N-acetyltransferase|uniref:GNAT family N-acetyltransferase n=1 Tax=Serratia grimesii TaxID=82995 RepID=UPI00077C547C|nr:GNAT family N-acetyltransferase [Serratia grimesii]CAI0849428.1 Acetyltransferase (GNAT) family [Serratia grimesii]CAI2429170.1 Acetyltransferase (GNAT) family [Serratia grimesii]SUI34160.1 Acetyltransferase (GNAT) family [Serratia grimesii]